MKVVEFFSNYVSVDQHVGKGFIHEDNYLIVVNKEVPGEPLQKHHFTNKSVATAIGKALGSLHQAGKDLCQQHPDMFKIDEELIID